MIHLLKLIDQQKKHNVDNPIRLIVSLITAPTSHLFRYLKNKIKNTLILHKTSTNLVNQIKDIGLNIQKVISSYSLT